MKRTSATNSRHTPHALRAESVLAELKKHADPIKAKILSGFFKTGKGEYGEGDQFLGITVPIQRKIAQEYKDIELREVEKLMQSPFHEARLTGLLILVYKIKNSNELTHKAVFDFYLRHTASVNNWDLVDSTARDIVGGYIFEYTKDKKILYKLVRSKQIWERRIAIIATFYFIARNDFEDTIKISEILMSDTHDLIHKAVGWMLREMGKRDQKILISFLEKHAHKMPRTMLRYSIERFSPDIRRTYLRATSSIIK